MQKIIEALVPTIMTLLFKVLTPAQIEKVADKALDLLEVAIAKSENKYDDEIVIPLIAVLREAFSIEDNDTAKA